MNGVPAAREFRGEDHAFCYQEQSEATPVRLQSVGTAHVYNANGMVRSYEAMIIRCIDNGIGWAVVWEMTTCCGEVSEPLLWMHVLKLYKVSRTLCVRRSSPPPPWTS